ncbi:thioredoxin reductase [Amycolatopsis antarctica]|uniref:Thioredoxin reductase n=1 Tax=Amycolatopsis antarctica TaxID=1854586 RepID=A0A263D5T6_9PSEU|nr:NAD(P)/FAD-dependent oxidoreductase [Amycolatopsis antarctica]OZM73783.1 thioredoxin reductase [Amycolatopsis antarctica]
MTGKTYDVVIVGAGPAGLSAALLLGRARRRVAVVDAGRPRNAAAAHAQGYLSRDGIVPAELLRIGRAEVAGYGVTLIDDIALRIRPDRAVELAGGSVLTARRVLVTTGLADELPDIPGVADLWAIDVHHCPFCHGWEVRDQALGVLGTSPHSPHVAHLLRQWSAEVTLFTHTLDLGADERRTLEARGITVVPGAVERLTTENGRLRGVLPAGGPEVPRDAVFVTPRFVAKDSLLTATGCPAGENGDVRVDGDGRTGVAWLWAAGNAVDPRGSLITSASDGSRAAMSITADLLGEEIGAARSKAGVPA